MDFLKATTVRFSVRLPPPAKGSAFVTSLGVQAAPGEFRSTDRIAIGAAAQVIGLRAVATMNGWLWCVSGSRGRLLGRIGKSDG
jgi:hypothetical protein